MIRPRVITRANPFDRSPSSDAVRCLVNDDSFFLVMADGASRSAFGGAFAEHLVDLACPDWFDMDNELWMKHVRTSFDPLAASTTSIVRNKFLRHGSASTLLLIRGLVSGLTIDLEFFVVGDSVPLFWTGSNYSLQDACSPDFGSPPDLVRSGHGDVDPVRFRLTMLLPATVVACTDGAAAHLAGSSVVPPPCRLELSSFADVADDVAVVVIEFEAPALVPPHRSHNRRLSQTKHCRRLSSLLRRLFLR